MKPSRMPGVLRFEANRTLTGQGHELFRTAADAVGPRPAAALARTLLGTGQVDSVHMYGNVITVDLSKGHTADGLSDLVRDMYQYWKPGMEPPAFVEAVPEEAPAGGGAAAPAAGGGGTASLYDQRIPQNLRDRSSAALAKWKANH